MKTPTLFISRVLSTAAVIAVCAMGFTQTASADSNARNSDRDRPRDRSPYDRDRYDRDRYDRDRDRHDRHDHDHDNYTGNRRLGAAVQRALAVRGYYRGPTDGVVVPYTRRSIARFQADHRLRASGMITAELLRALKLGN